MQVGNGIERVKLKKQLVDFLIRPNVERREDSGVDKAFVKGLVIAVFSVQKIKSQENLHLDLISFIKGMHYIVSAFENTYIYKSSCDFFVR